MIGRFSTIVLGTLHDEDNILLPRFAMFSFLLDVHVCMQANLAGYLAHSAHMMPRKQKAGQLHQIDIPYGI